MGSSKRRRADRARRPPMRSPGRPPVARREHRQRFWEAIARGLSSEEAGAVAGVSPAVGTRWFREGGGMPSVSPSPLSGRYLSFVEREEIAILQARDCGVREIAQRLGRSPSTISRELRRNAATRGGGLEYRASTAQWHAVRRALRPKAAKLAANDALRQYVQDRLAGTIHGPRRHGRAGPGGSVDRSPARAPSGNDDGRPHGARSRSRTDSRSISPMMSPCGSHTRPSTKRSTSKAAALCAVNWSRTCAPGERCACRGSAPAGAARSSSAPRS